MDKRKRDLRRVVIKMIEQVLAIELCIDKEYNEEIVRIVHEMGADLSARLNDGFIEIKRRLYRD
jgi:hypothetical protein